MSKNIFFGAIADDFTGASDLAALLARSGAPVSLRLGTKGMADPTPHSAFEIIALKSRTIARDEAIGQSLGALQWLKSHGAERFFFKYCSTFDSTAEGNIGPVSEAIMAALGESQTLYAPSFPQNGRTVYQGTMFVNGIRLDESPMRNHPLTPMRDGNIARHLQAQSTGKTGIADWHTIQSGAAALTAQLQQLEAQDIAHVVMDALSDQDLQTIAEASQNKRFITGGSAIAAPLPALYRDRGHVAFTPGKPPHQATEATPLVLSGSCSDMTRRQVKAFSANHPHFHLNALELAKDDTHLEAAKKWLSQQNPTQPKLIYASADPAIVAEVQAALGTEQAGAIVEAAMAALAQYAAEIGIRRIVVAGGETSGAVVQALDIARLAIGAEIAPGVPWTFAMHNGASIALALKSGNFGGEHFFTEALDALG